MIPPTVAKQPAGKHAQVIKLFQRTKRIKQLVDGQGFIFDIQGYCSQAVDLYLQMSGVRKRKPATTIFCPEGARLAADDCS